MKHSQLRTWLVMIVTTLTIYSASDIFMPAIAHMAADLGISEARATSNYTFYYLVLMLSYAFLGPLCDSANRRRILLCSVSACLMGCVLSASAQNMLMMNTGRSLQALATGLTMLTTQLWIANFSDKSNMVSRLAWFTLITTLAPVLAPVLGGLITDHLSWRYNFWLIAAVCIVIIIGCVLLVALLMRQVRQRGEYNKMLQQTNEAKDELLRVANDEKLQAESARQKILEVVSHFDRISQRDDVELSQREVQIVQLLCKGLLTKEVAEQLNISIRTVETHKNHIYRKLGISNTVELLRYAERNGLVEATR